MFRFGRTSCTPSCQINIMNKKGLEANKLSIVIYLFSLSPYNEHGDAGETIWDSAKDSKQKTLIDRPRNPLHWWIHSDGQALRSPCSWKFFVGSSLVRNNHESGHPHGHHIISYHIISSCLIRIPCVSCRNFNNKWLDFQKQTDLPSYKKRIQNPAPFQFTMVYKINSKINLANRMPKSI